MKDMSFMKVSKRVVRGTNALLLFVAICTSVVFSQDRRLGPSDRAEFEAFMDGLIGAQLEAYDIAGAMVSVVKDGSVFFAKGYGYADIGEKKGVVADETLFRIASISKLFVWTAVMQLAEQGKLDLNVDVNTYLTGFKIPDTYDEPVTLAHLMDHTAGFEELIILLFSRDKECLLSLSEILAQELPARVRPPGEVSSYSNHGSAIAAHVVELVSGLSWDEYVEQNIFAPLGMEYTTFRQPIPEPLATAASKGYSYGSGEFHEADFEYVPLAPVGAACTTSTDMANFMIAHLQHGQFGDIRILESETARQMHGASFRHAPEVNAMSHGFIDMSMNGHWVIGHDGALVMFKSTMALLPDHGVGLFVSYNSPGGQMALGKVYEAFMDRYYRAGEIERIVPTENSRKRLSRFVGSYCVNRYSHGRLTRIGMALRPIRVILTEDGALKTFIKGKSTRWIETSSLAFREEDGLGTLAFREDDKGRITHMFLGDVPVVAFERIGLADMLAIHRWIAIVVTSLFLGVVVFLPVRRLVRRKYGVSIASEFRLPLAACVLSWSTCLLFLVFIMGFIYAFKNSNIMFGISPVIKSGLAIGVAAAVLTAGKIVYAVHIWRSRSGLVWGRIWYSVITLTCIVFLWQLSHWNLLGFCY